MAKMVIDGKMFWISSQHQPSSLSLGPVKNAKSNLKTKQNMTSSLYSLCFSHCAWWGLWSKKKKRHRTSDHFEVSLLFQLTDLHVREPESDHVLMCALYYSVILHGVRPNIAQCREKKWALAAIDLFIPSQWMTSNAEMSHDIQKNLSPCVNEIRCVANGGH